MLRDNEGACPKWVTFEAKQKRQWAQQVLTFRKPDAKAWDTAFHMKQDADI